MAIFTLWAPDAKEVKVRIGEIDIDMKAVDKGWWTTDVPLAGGGTEYSFVVDDSKPLPDPRSPHQPHGVHGPSSVTDHNAFPWTDIHWQPPSFPSGVFYELHVGTFTPEGTFRAAIDRLDHLVQLGITHVELMPVNEFSGSRGWGYDGADLFAPHHNYGGPDGLKRFVNACHEKGLAVVLDVVYNHLGPVGNYLSQFGPYFTSRYVTPWGEAVNFDGKGSDEVRRFFIDNALMWLRDYHFDGLRVDAVHAIIDTLPLPFLEELSDEVRRLGEDLGRRLLLIAENDLNDPRVARDREAGGYGFDAQWNEDFHHALHAVLTGENGGYYADFGSLADLAKSLEKGFAYDGRYSEYRGRRHGREAAGLPANRFIGFIQNHDQVGNRAQGERLCHLVNTGRQKIAAAILLTSPFVPLVFQGEEWAASTPFLYFTDHEDPELARAVREGRRKEFASFKWDPQQIPDPQDLDTFRNSKLNWKEIKKDPHGDMLDWYRQLIRLRRRIPVLSDGDFGRVQTQFQEEARCIVLKNGPVVTACNLDRQRRKIVMHGNANGPALFLTSDPGISGTSEEVSLPPDSVAVFAPEHEFSAE